MDKGIDLIGTWKLPSLLEGDSLRVLVQCKAVQHNSGPVLIRELEGAFLGSPVAWRHGGRSDAGEASVGNIMAILAATKHATKATRDAMERSSWPMAYMHVGLDGVMEQVFWNRRASDIGLEGLGVTTRFLPRSKDSDDTVKKEAVLTWKDQVWEVNDR